MSAEKSREHPSTADQPDKPAAVPSSVQDVFERPPHPPPGRIDEGARPEQIDLRQGETRIQLQRGGSPVVAPAPAIATVAMPAPGGAADCPGQAGRCGAGRRGRALRPGAQSDGGHLLRRCRIPTRRLT